MLLEYLTGRHRTAHPGAASGLQRKLRIVENTNRLFRMANSDQLEWMPEYVAAPRRIEIANPQHALRRPWTMPIRAKVRPCLRSGFKEHSWNSRTLRYRDIASEPNGKGPGDVIPRPWSFRCGSEAPGGNMGCTYIWGQHPWR